MSPRLAFTLQRLLLTIPILLVMSVCVFLMLRLIPGDPVRSMLGLQATPENVATIRGQLGLDRPLVQQYAEWMGNLLHGDFGQDYISHTPMSELLSQRLPVTLELTLFGILMALLIGIPLGVVAAVGPRWARVLTDLLAVAGVAVPAFWLGIMLVLLFTGALQLLPPAGYARFVDDPLNNLRYMVLPVLTLSAAQGAYILRTTRAAMLEVLESPFITFLRAKGISESTIRFRHALRNAAVPIVTVVGIQFGALLGGAVVIETLFALPGIGSMVVTAINLRNYPVVQGGVLVIATLFILINLATDLLYGVLDPRTAAGASS